MQSPRVIKHADLQLGTTVGLSLCTYPFLLTSKKKSGFPGSCERMNGWHKLSNESSNLPEICAADRWTPEKSFPQTVDGPKALVYMNEGKGGEAF